VTGPGTSAVYVCYLSLEDPLVETQVVAYLEGLAQQGHRIHLLTFDGKLDPGQREQVAADLRRRGIAWHSLRYHKRPSLPATLYDAMMGAFLTARLVRRHRLAIIHARGHVPAATALVARWLTGAHLIFDIRGLIGEEYVDAGRWKLGSVPFRITKRIERATLRRTSGAVVLTERVRRYLFGRSEDDLVQVIPCCANLPELEASGRASNHARHELGIGERPAMVYVGKFTGYYLEGEMVEFFSIARERRPGLVFLVLTQADPAPIVAEFDRRAIPRSDFRIARADHRQIGRYLAVADFGVSFVRPCFSKMASSPTKIGEYLGAGLPVVSTAKIGDVDELLTRDDVGVLVDHLSREAYAEAARGIEALLEDPGVGDRCRTTARLHLSLSGVGVPRYDRLYRRVAARTASRSGPLRVSPGVGP
jgi:glycosyltransferase involved in cell wall biosynthesis